MPDEIFLHSSCANQVTCISNDFIDNFMPECSGEFVKTYLYLMRTLTGSGVSFSIKKAADTLHHTEADVRRALSYWEEKGLIRLEYDGKKQLVGVCVHPSSGDIERTSQSNIEDIPVEYFEEEVEEEPKKVETILFDEQTLEEVYQMAEMLKGKPLSSREMRFVIEWNETLGLAPSLIEYLIELCMNNNHSSFFYMNSIAEAWNEKGITTEEQARAESSVHSKTYYAVVKAFGISGRNLNTREEGYLNKWISTYHFSDDLISEACDRALNNTGKVSFAYAEKILNEWNENGIKTMSDVKKKDALKKSTKPKATVQKTTSFQNFTERNTTDEELLELERKLLQ